MNMPTVPKQNDSAKYPALMTKDPDLTVKIVGSKVDRDPDKGKDLQRHSAGNKASSILGNPR